MLPKISSNIPLEKGTSGETTQTRRTSRVCFFKRVFLIGPPTCLPYEEFTSLRRLSGRAIYPASFPYVPQELYGNMSGIRMWGLSRAGGMFFVLYWYELVPSP